MRRKAPLDVASMGITRTKRNLIVTWNSGQKGDATPNLAVEALRGWWEGG